MSRPVTFLSDYGTADGFAGLCRAVIERESPGTTVIDISHEVPRHDVRRGAILLADALPFLPAGVHLAVVDPGVGTARRAIAVRAEEKDRCFVGPDNGLLVPAIERAGGVAEAVDLAQSQFRAESVSATFHGRDIFAPVAAALARGEPLSATGEPIQPAALVAPVMPHPISKDGAIEAHTLLIDGFGNVALDLERGTLGFDPMPGDHAEVRIGDRPLDVRITATFAEGGDGELILFEDSTGRFALALNGGDAAAAYGLELDQVVLIRPHGGSAA